MSETYTKLFTSITASTVWQEPAGTRLTWITMLAMADKNGDVFASIPGLARIANVTLEEVEAALRCFLSPDPYSRTKEHDGRRIEEIDGGWRLLNHAKFREIRSAAERAEYKREWDRANRPSGHARAQSDSPTAVRRSPIVPTNAAAPTPTPSTEQKDQELSARPSVTRFDDWWSAYPKKVGKKPARAKWQTLKLDRIADALIADVRRRAAEDDGWIRGFVPDPLTYLNQERWQDDLRTAPTTNGARHAEPKESFAQRITRKYIAEQQEAQRAAGRALGHDDAGSVDHDVGVLWGQVVKPVR